MPPVLERCRTWFWGLLTLSQPADRRRSQRLPFHDSLSVAASAGFIYHASARDQNAGGIGAIVCGDLLIGEIVWLRLAGRKVRAAVRNRHGYRYGLEFLEK
jgi:hypothetical protein